VQLTSACSACWKNYTCPSMRSPAPAWARSSAASTRPVARPIRSRTPSRESPGATPSRTSRRARNSSFRRKQDDRDFLVGLQLGLRKDGFSYARGLLQGQNLGLLLKRFAAGAELVEDFDSLPIPYRAVAADAITGDPVVLDSGDLAQAMRASMRVPGVFEPVEIDGRLLADGGMSAQTLISVARRKGVDILIVVDLTEEEDVPADAINTPSTLLAHLLLMVVTRNAREELGELSYDDNLIQPNLEGYGSADFGSSTRMVPPGEAGARVAEYQIE